MGSTTLNSMKKNQKIKVQLGGKTIGFINNERFERKVRASRHLLQSVSGWAISIEVLEKLAQQSIEEIWIRDLDSKSTYKATLKDFMEKGVRVDYCDPQLCLPLPFWKKTNIKKTRSKNQAI